MLKNYLKIAFRNLIKYKVYSLINIIGFSIALVPVVLTILYIFYELSYDRYNKNYDRIYRIVNEEKFYDQTIQSGIVPNPLAAAMRADLPEVKYVTRMRVWSGFISYNGQRHSEYNILYTDPNIFKVFTFHIIEGNPNTALDDNYSILLSESMAQKYFANENPVGKTIKLSDVNYMKVTGVFEDMPVNSHFHANFIVPASLLDGSSPSIGGNNNPNSWGFSIFFTYFLLKKNVNPNELLKKFPAFLNKYSQNDFFNKSKIYFQSLGNIHLHSHLQTEFENNGDIKTIYLYLSVALIILIIACINYVNLATARTSQRIKEIRIRKIIGAHRKQLIMQLLTETILITFCSFLITIMLVELLLPYFNSFVERDIQFNIFQNFNMFIWMAVFIWIISLVTGLYPATSLSSIKPLSYLSGGVTFRGPHFRGILVITQFLLSTALIYCAIVVREQLHYISEKDLGYDHNNIIVINLRGMSKSRVDALKNEIGKYPDVLTVSSSAGLPNEPIGSGGIDYPGKPDNIHFEIAYSVVDYNYLDLYGLKIVEGRKFLKQFPSDKNDAVIINETAARELGWSNPIGKQIKYTSPYGRSYRTIIGVVRDFNSGSLYSRVIPYYFVIDPEHPDYQVSIKIKPKNIHQTLIFLQKEMKLFEPEYSFSYSFFSDLLKAFYGSVYKLQKIFSIFSLFTLAVACLGLFGMISFVTEVRKKEIGIRKVLGASIYHIAKIFLSGIMRPVIFASVFSIPFAYFIMNKWLSNFAYRTKIHIELFIGAALIVYIVSLLVIILQIVKASFLNPVETLRNE
ncbi:MAG: ABC transporter permease [Bacteroidetes bacterium]|nr:ABC transporter permease [Bacteroidota bacterium]